VAGDEHRRLDQQGQDGTAFDRLRDQHRKQVFQLPGQQLSEHDLRMIVAVAVGARQRR
jgi:hypothetical protein